MSAQDTSLQKGDGQKAQGQWDWEWTRLNNDVNGNPRYAVHFLALVPDLSGSPTITLTAKYAEAVRRANKIGGRRYHCKAYGGGIVFQSYSLGETENAIARIIEQERGK